MRKAAGRTEGSKPIPADNCHGKSGKGFDARQQPQGPKDGNRQVGGEPGGHYAVLHCGTAGDATAGVAHPGKDYRPGPPGVSGRARRPGLGIESGQLP